MSINDLLLKQNPDSKPANQVSRAQKRKHKSKNQRIKRLVLLFVVFLFLIVATAAVGYYWYTSKIDKQITRLDNPFKKMDEKSRPQTTDNKAVNILVLGSDSRSSNGDLKKWVNGGQRSDVMMLVQFSGDNQHINVLSIPRDSWVPIEGHGDGKINWAFSFGGAPLAIKTVEDLTGVRIDHFALVDFTSFVQLTDALGGVQISTVTEGKKQYNGQEALAFVRQRYHLPNGDFDRGRRHQAWMRAIISQARNGQSLDSVSKVDELIKIVTKSIAVDDNFTFSDMRSLAMKMHSIPSSNINFLTMPHLGTKMVGTQSTVTVDKELLGELSKAWQEDRADKFIKANKDKLTTLDKGLLN